MVTSPFHHSILHKSNQGNEDYSGNEKNVITGQREDIESDNMLDNQNNSKTLKTGSIDKVHL